jgi:hypothetical protein
VYGDYSEEKIEAFKRIAARYDRTERDHSVRPEKPVAKLIDKTPTVAIKLTPQQLWKQLHDYAFEVEEWTPQKAAHWYKNVWRRRVNEHHGCTGCGSHWSQITGKNPPDFSTREAFYKWTVDRHNDVNVYLGKPIWQG